VRPIRCVCVSTSRAASKLITNLHMNTVGGQRPCDGAASRHHGTSCGMLSLPSGLARRRAPDTAIYERWSEMRSRDMVRRSESRT
jgi:hypothetical protein